MPRIQLDNVEVEAAEGSTILQAAAQVGIAIPTLCHLPGIEPQTSCLVCVVRVNGAQRLVPACATRVAEGMVVENATPAVREARRTALELLLAEHAGECFAPCSQVCPAHLDIPEMVRQVREGELALAIQTVREALVLPATLGHACPGLCEKGCRRSSADASLSICALHRFVGEEELKGQNHWLPTRARLTGKRVAIVGAGPAGLAVAYELLKAGHACTLFDTQAKAGGSLRYGPGSASIPEWVLDGEIDLITQLGAQWRLGQACVPATLANEYDVVAIAQGAALRADNVFVSASAQAPRPHAVQDVADGKELAAEIIQHFAM